MEKEICEVVDCDKKGLNRYKLKKNYSVEFHHICDYHDEEAKEGKELNFKQSYIQPN